MSALLMCDRCRSLVDVVEANIDGDVWTCPKCKHTLIELESIYCDACGLALEREIVVVSDARNIKRQIHAECVSEWRKLTC